MTERSSADRLDPSGPERPAAQTEPDNGLESALLAILARFGQPVTRATLAARAAREPGPWTLEQAHEALESFGLSCTPARYRDGLEESVPGLILALDPDGHAHVRGIDGSDRGNPLASGAPVLVVAAPERPVSEDQGEPRGRFGHWFWGPIVSAKGLFAQVALAAVFVNLFALSASIFSMIVYDRVMPNNAVETLTALVVGVGIVLASDFVIRMLRAWFLDLAGARADMAIADSLFEQMLDAELGARRASTGTMASTVREFESIRDFFTSATLTTLIDLPFALLFIAVIAAIGGPLAWVPIAAVPLILIASVVIQPRLRRLVRLVQEDGHQKNSVLVETLQGIETIKSLGAGATMRRRWQTAVAHQAAVNLKVRALSSLATQCANLGTQVVWIGTVAFGFFLIRDGQIGSGAIVACAMLSGRAIAPLGQLAQLLTRVNQAIVGYRALQQIMRQPREHPAGKAGTVVPARLEGAIEMRGVHFAYPGQQQGALDGINLRIAAGERVALVGRIGSGKTTILNLLLGLYRPDRGEILFDGIDSRQIEPAHLRRNIGAVLQDVWLVSGSLRENIALGGDEPTDDQVLAAARIAGVHDFVAPHPDGYRMELRERGAGLSGGQRQAIAVARALVGSPPILLLDEPTSATDIPGEQALIERMKSLPKGRTVLLVTHRPSMLALVDRVVVIDGGKVVADGPKAQILERASGTPRPTSTARVS